MKNKKLIYILVPLALLVWGLIFYRIFMGMEDKKPVTPSYMMGKLENDKSKADTFKLIANYRDPFLSGSLRTVQPIIASSSLENRRSLSQAKNTPVVPDVQYYGLISNSKNKGKIGLVKFQGIDYLMREGEIAKTEIKIIKLFKDSLILLYQKNKHSIKRI